MGALFDHVSMAIGPINTQWCSIGIIMGVLLVVVTQKYKLTRSPLLFRIVWIGLIVGSI